MKKLKGLLSILFILFLTSKVSGQTYTQTFIDKCSGEVKVATTTYVNGNAFVSFYNQMRTFTPAEVQSGAMQLWLQSVYLAYSTTGCPTNQVVQQTVQQTVNQAVQQAAQQAATQAASAAASQAASSAASQAASSAASSAASNAASSAASTAASGAASSAASSSASSAASSSASSAAASAATPPPAAATPPPSSSSGSSAPASSSSSSNNSSSSSSSSSSESKSSTSSSSESKSETKSETKSESKSESKSEEKKSESKSEEKKEEKKSEEKKEEKKEESKEEKKESKKEEKKKESKPAPINPLLLASDLSVVESSETEWAAILSLGISKSSLMGDKSYSLNTMIWSNLKQFAVSGGITKMNLDSKGKLTSINSYSLTSAYLTGNYMILGGFTKIVPNPKYGVYGYNLGIVSLMLQNQEGGFDLSVSNSTVAFWTKPYPVNKKLTLSPQIFVMPPGTSMNTVTGLITYGNTVGILAGSSVDYKLSKRFGLSFNYKINTSTAPGAPILSNFLIGSRIML